MNRFAKEVKRGVPFNMDGKTMSVLTVFSFIGTSLSAWLGGWDAAAKILIASMAADFLLGILAAGKAHKINSNVMFWGGVRKFIVLFIIGYAALMDEVMFKGQPICRNVVMWFYIGREGLSMVEKVGLLGIYIPPFLKDMLEQLQEKGNERPKKRRRLKDAESESE